MDLRSSRPITKSMQTFKELEKNMLPLNSNVVGHYFYLRNKLTVTNLKYFNKLPYYKDVKDQLLLDVLSIWTKASLPVLRKQRIEAKLKDLIDRYNALTLISTMILGNLIGTYVDKCQLAFFVCISMLL